MKYLNAKQVLALLEAARENSTRDWCLCLMTFRHALRSHEVRNLKLTDINLTDGTVRIERAKGSVSIMAEQYSDIYAIQRKAGHKNISKTMIYTHVSDRQADSACREALMSPFA